MENEKLCGRNRVIAIPHSPKSPRSPKISTFDFIHGKSLYYRRVIQDTIVAMQRYKGAGIMNQSDFHVATATLETLFGQLQTIAPPTVSASDAATSAALNACQRINDELASAFRAYGTMSIDDLMSVCLSNDYLAKHIGLTLMHKYELIRRYVHPIGYRVVTWKGKQRSDKPRTLQKNRIVEDVTIVENAATLECFDLARTNKLFPLKVYGIRVVLHDSVNSRTMIVNGITDDLAPFCIDNPFMVSVQNAIQTSPPATP